MTVDPLADVKAWNPAHVEIQQVGRWKYEISISEGFWRVGNEFGGPYRYGYQRAVKKGQRMLAKYQLREKRRRNVTEVR